MEEKYGAFYQQTSKVEVFKVRMAHALGSMTERYMIFTLMANIHLLDELTFCKKSTLEYAAALDQLKTVFASTPSALLLLASHMVEHSERIACTSESLYSRKAYKRKYFIPLAQVASLRANGPFLHVHYIMDTDISKLRKDAAPGQTKSAR
ncbi:hypothetical protein CCR75_005041 [Bremia lactucae]|uniref:Uncharacterized protein n=1 Tax=Bremia lactucae TaxID=4779 RepID=A0A976IF90_BRELC|nr:hypothetical protein CCR75_005041 [Bremia lactucae]